MKDINNLNEYIVRKQAYELLEVDKHNYEHVDKILLIEWGLSIVEVNGEYFYRTRDIQSVYDENKLFFEKYCIRDEAIRICGFNFIKEKKIQPIHLTSKNKYFFKKTYNQGKSRGLYNRADLEQCSVKNKWRKDYIGSDEFKNIVVIEGIEYIDRLELRRQLNVIPERIDLVCEEFSIKRIITKKDYFNLDDVRQALSESKEYYSQYYTRTQVLEKLRLKEIYNLGASISVPNKYAAVLFKQTYLYDRGKVDKAVDKKNNIHIYEKNGKRVLVKDEVITRLEITKCVDVATRELCSDWKIEKVRIDGKIGYYETDIENVINSILEFYNNYYSNYETKKLLTPNERKALVPIVIGNKYMRYMKESCNTAECTSFYMKSEIDKILNNKKAAQSEIDNKYLSYKDACKFLDISLKVWKKIKREYSFEFIQFQGVEYFLKEDLEKILDMRAEYYKEYIDYKECKEQYFDGKLRKVKLMGVPRYEPPCYALTLTHSVSTSHTGGVFKRSEIEESLKNKLLEQELKVNTNILADTNYNTFLARLNDYKPWIGFDEESLYTKTKWFKYVESKLDRTIMRGKDLSNIINQLIYCTMEVKNFLIRNNKKEIYMLTANEINLVLRSINSYVYCKEIYLFLREVAMDLQITNKENSKSFKITGISTPEDIFGPKEKADEQNQIYSFEIYSKVFDYCTDVKKHTINSVKEMYEKNKCIYASTWLYSVLHLNNAWRNGDVRDFPRLPVEDVLGQYGVKDISWFQNNAVTLPMARAIVYRVNQWEFTMSKTQIKGSFFCSDELAPAFATSVLLLTLFNKLSGRVTKEALMNFETKYNDVSTSALKKFFKEIDLHEFVFASRKFNKTIMTYIYYIANLSGDSKALLYAMKLRAHVVADTTIGHYLNLNTKDIEELSRQLFARGEFGFIPTLLIKKVNGGQLNFDDLTNEVTVLNESFGDIVKINATIGFMNSLRAERELVVKKISEMSLEEAQLILTDIFARKLPSKESKDIQCLYNRTGCKRTELKSCFECPYHIPTIYALMTLCNAIKQDIIEFNGTTILTKKYKLSIAISKKKVVIIEAMQKFRKDYIYECLGYGRKEFMSMIANIPRPSEFTSLI